MNKVLRSADEAVSLVPDGNEAAGPAIGIVTETNTSLFNGPNTTLSLQIFRNAASPFPGAVDRAWGAALTLILIVFVFTITARLITTFFGRRMAA